jgi:hypothetical protein
LRFILKGNAYFHYDTMLRADVLPTKSCGKWVISALLFQSSSAFALSYEAPEERVS